MLAEYSDDKDILKNEEEKDIHEPFIDNAKVAQEVTHKVDKIDRDTNSESGEDDTKLAEWA